MDRKATTFRIDPQVRDGLFKLSALLHRPANQLANDALKEYVDRRILEVEDDLEFDPRRPAGLPQERSEFRSRHRGIHRG